MKKLRSILIALYMKIVKSHCEAMREGKKYLADLAVIRETKSALLVQLAINETQYKNPVVTWIPKSQVAYWPYYQAFFVAEWLLKKFELPAKFTRVGLAPPQRGTPKGFKKATHWKEL